MSGTWTIKERQNSQILIRCRQIFRFVPSEYGDFWEETAVSNHTDDWNNLSPSLKIIYCIISLRQFSSIFNQINNGVLRRQSWALPRVHSSLTAFSTVWKENNCRKAAGFVNLGHKRVHNGKNLMEGISVPALTLILNIPNIMTLREDKHELLNECQDNTCSTLRQCGLSLAKCL